MTVPAPVIPTTSLMLQEAMSAGDCVALQLSQDVERYAELGRTLRSTTFNSAVTVARGSSDHASSYVAYLIMSRMGRLVTSLPMSLVTLYKSPLVTRDTLAIAISQSSPARNASINSTFTGLSSAIRIRPWGMALLI